MLEYPLSILELVIYITAITIIIIGLVKRKHYMILWSFALVLVNVILYAETYATPTYVSLTLLLLGSISLLTIVFTGLVTYIVDRSAAKIRS